MSKLRSLAAPMGVLTLMGFLTSALFSCRSAEPVPDCRDDLLEAPFEHARQFRATYAALAGETSAEDLGLQILLPGKSLDAAFDPAVVDAAPETVPAIDELEKRFIGWCPSHLHARSLAAELGEAPSAAELRTRFHDQGPVTFIVLPGIFSEYVDAYPFDALFQRESAFAAHEVALNGLETAAYNVRDLASAQAPLGEHIRLASLDDADGQPLVQLVLAVPVRGSLETIGAHGEAVEPLLQRLDATFAALATLPHPPNVERLYMLGYSRGGPLGLELLRRAHAESGHGWTAQLRGFVSLAGVLWGSGLADAAFGDRDSSSYHYLKTLSRLSDKLQLDEPGDSKSDLAGKQVENTARWARAAVELLSFANPPPRRLEREDSPLAIPKLGHLSELLVSIATDTFRIDRTGEYFNNVRRFKVLIAAARAGLRELTTEARTQWWRENTLPADLNYFAVAGTMADMHRKGAPRTLLKSPYYARRGADYGGLRRSYYDLAQRSQVELNDSQVTLPKAWFWPELVAALHPEQPAFEARFLGVVGTHHWGLALPYVIETTQGPDTNPFPRLTLLEALAAHLLALEDE